MSSLQDFYFSDPTDLGGRSERYSIPLDGKEISLGPFPFRPRSIVLVNQTAGNMIVTDDRGEQYIAAQSVGATYGMGDTVRLRAKLDVRQTSGKATVVVSNQAAGISAAQLSSFASVGAQGVEQLIAASTGPLVLAVANQDIPGASITFTINGQNATYQAFGFFDFDVGGVTGNGVMVGIALLDVTTGVGQALLGDLGVGTRGTMGMVGGGAIAQGLHTVKLQAHKTAAGGAGVVNNAQLVVTIKDA